MQLKHVKNVANESGIGLEGKTIKIDRNPDLIGRDLYGYTSPDGKTITLYPDAFTNRTELIKTIAHERTHAYQVDVFGKPTSTSMLRDFENGALAAEDIWMNYLKLK